MPLKGKYLKYSPEITLEIFTLIYNKLVDLKWASNEIMSIRTMWKEFNVFPFLCDLGYSEMKLFGTFSASRYNDTETTVQEILGYDPFVKEEVIPEYVELLKDFDNTRTGKIFDTKNPIPKMNDWSHVWTWESIFKNDLQRPYFKPSTKEAFDVQNQPKSIEKWSVGSYVVAINDGNARGKSQDKYKIGFIDIITNKFNNEIIGLKFSSNCCNKLDFKWFATLQEAEIFAKELVKPVKEEVKQPLKQAVHCKTQEEWDFVCDKFDKAQHVKVEFSTKGYNIFNYTEEFRGWNKLENFEKYKYQIFSFQEWCDLNGYKMEKEVKFEVGKWYKTKMNSFVKYKETNNGGFFVCSECIMYDKLILQKAELLFGEAKISDFKSISIEEIQQYLPDNHPDKLPLKTKEMILDESHIGKLVSLTYSGRFYDEVLVTKESGQIYLLNNVKRDNDGHSDKSVYKHSLLFTSIENANDYCSNIKLLEKSNIIESALKSLLETKGQPIVKSNQEFKVGDWVIIKKWHYDKRIELNQIAKINAIDLNSGTPFKLELSIPCINNTKLWYFKSSEFIHATPEEINQHLISIEQIPAEQFAYQGEYKCDDLRLPTSTIDALYSLREERLNKPVLLLSVDGEELPMVSIIKTNSIKQLLNNE